MNTFVYEGWTFFTYDDIPVEAEKLKGTDDPLIKDDDQSRIDQKNPLIRLAAEKSDGKHIYKVYKDYGWMRCNRHILTVDGKRISALESGIELIAIANHVSLLDEKWIQAYISGEECFLIDHFSYIKME